MAVFSGAFTMKNASVKFDATNYANNLRKVRFVPSQDIQTYNTLVPDGTLQDVGTATWTVELEGLQGVGGLAAAIRTAAAAGTNMVLVFQPQSGTGKDIVTATVVALQIPFGGEEGSYQTFDVTLPVVGAPVWTVSP